MDSAPSGTLNRSFVRGHSAGVIFSRKILSTLPQILFAKSKLINSRLDYPIRAISFSCDDKIIATGSEDPFIDLAYVEDGEFFFQL